MNVKIEKVTKEDSLRLLEIYSYYVKNTAISFEWEVPSCEDFINRIINISAKYPYLKAVIDNNIVGYAYANTFKNRKAYEWAVESTIYIDKDYKGLGIGRLLYSELEKSLKTIGILNINACIAYPKVIDDKLTDDSVRFHKAMGYTYVGTFHNIGYKFNTWYDMVWMEKQLGDHIENQDNVKFGDWNI